MWWPWKRRDQAPVWADLIDPAEHDDVADRLRQLADSWQAERALAEPTQQLRTVGVPPHLTLGQLHRGGAL